MPLTWKTVESRRQQQGAEVRFCNEDGEFTYLTKYAQCLSLWTDIGKITRKNTSYSFFLVHLSLIVRILHLFFIVLSFFCHFVSIFGQSVSVMATLCLFIIFVTVLHPIVVGFLEKSLCATDKAEAQHWMSMISRASDIKNRQVPMITSRHRLSNTSKHHFL